MNRFGPIPQIAAEKRCGDCRDIKPLSDFYVQKSKNRQPGTIGSVYSRCKACHYAVTLKNNNKVEAKLRHNRKYKTDSEYRLKFQARKFVGHQVEKGRLSKPDHCQNCLEGANRLEAHHHLGYDRKNWLDLIWLCTRCHIAIEPRVGRRVKA